MGQKHSASTSGTFEELFVALDSDKSGDVDAKEIQAWIKDEQALGNTALDSRYLLEISKLILKAKRRVPSDESSPLVLTKPQILDFFGALPESDAKALTHSLRQEVGELRAKFLRRVFDRVRKRGYIDKEQLLHWVLTWPHLDNQPTVADSLFKEIDTNADARSECSCLACMRSLAQFACRAVDFDEFTAFFGHWSFRNFRQASAAILDVSTVLSFARMPSSCRCGTGAAVCRAKGRRGNGGEQAGEAGRRIQEDARYDWFALARPGAVLNCPAACYSQRGATGTRASWRSSCGECRSAKPLSR